jgi:glycosyltransferase involved in cell wall biosynthesis
MNKLFNLKILFVTHCDSLYGANRSLLQLIIELRDSYSIIPVVLLSTKGDFTKALDKENIEYHIGKFNYWMSSKKTRLGFLKSIISYLLNSLRFWKFALILRKEGINLIHSNSSIIDIGVWLKFFLKVPHIWHLREYGYDDYKFKFCLGKAYASYIFRIGAERYITISQSMKEYYSAILPKDRIEMIYNGIKISAISSENKTNSCNTEFCMVGLAFSNKNQLEAIKAMNFLIKNYGIKSAKLHIIGDIVPDYSETLNAYIREEFLCPYIIFHEYTEDIMPLLKKMDVGIVCSLKEGFGRVTVEYMLNHLPVIASNTGANPEIVLDKKSGYIYELGNVEQLAYYMKCFIDNSKLRNTMGDCGYELAIKKFSAELNAKKIAELYTTIL